MEKDYLKVCMMLGEMMSTHVMILYDWSCWCWFWILDVEKVHCVSMVDLVRCCLLRDCLSLKFSQGWSRVVWSFTLGWCDPFILFKNIMRFIFDDGWDLCGIECKVMSFLVWVTKDSCALKGFSWNLGILPLRMDYIEIRVIYGT